jgi:hypothetical protein
MGNTTVATHSEEIQPDARALGAFAHVPVESFWFCVTVGPARVLGTLYDTVVADVADADGPDAQNSRASW